MADTVLRLVDKHNEAAGGIAAVKEEVGDRDDQLQVMAEQLASISAEATEQGRARMASDMQADTLKAQLQKLRSTAGAELAQVRTQHEAAGRREALLQHRVKQAQQAVALQRRCKQHLLALYVRATSNATLNATSNAASNATANHPPYISTAVSAVPGMTPAQVQPLPPWASNLGILSSSGGLPGNDVVDIPSSVGWALDLSACGLSDEDLEVLCHLLLDKGSSRGGNAGPRVGGSFITDPPKHPGTGDQRFPWGRLRLLESLDLSGNALTDAGAQKLSALLLRKEMCPLRHLDLRNNFVTLQGVQTLANALSSRVDFRINPVTKVDVHSSGRIEAFTQQSSSSKIQGSTSNAASDSNKLEPPDTIRSKSQLQQQPVPQAAISAIVIDVRHNNRPPSHQCDSIVETDIDVGGDLSKRTLTSTSSTSLVYVPLEQRAKMKKGGKQRRMRKEGKSNANISGLIAGAVYGGQHVAGSKKLAMIESQSQAQTPTPK